MPRERDEIYRRWRSGDAEQLYKSLAQNVIVKAPAVYRRIVVDRNQSWLPQIVAMLAGDTKQDALVVVGALHLLGDDGLVDLLQKQGLRVERKD
jgi:uncharacterized protein YbaP (TraB family)